MKHSLPIRIVKVGGSLLDWPSLPRTLRAWLADQPAAFNVLLCGGGTFVEAIRRADVAFSLGEVKSHWLAIDAMSLTARLLAALLPDVPVCVSYEELVTRMTQPLEGTVILDAAEFLREHEPLLPGHRLPSDWSVSSDSIAARVAVVLRADELVLLKSTDPPTPPESRFGMNRFVDQHFSSFHGLCLRVKPVNLRAIDYNEAQGVVGDVKHLPRV